MQHKLRYATVVVVVVVVAVVVFIVIKCYPTENRPGDTKRFV